MQKYIDAISLYEQAVKLEAQALSNVQKLNTKHFALMGDDDITAWKVWTAILNERTAFKHDVVNAPAVDVFERKKGMWKNGICSRCGYNWGKVSIIASVPDFCPGCGADMKRGMQNEV